jgi:hypothetical protein
MEDIKPHPTYHFKIQSASLPSPMERGARLCEYDIRLWGEVSFTNG